MRAAGIAAAVGMLLAAALAFGQASIPAGGEELEALARSAAEGNADAARELNLRGERGDAVAQRLLGIMHLYGRGTRKNESEAVSWFRRAAVQGDIASMHNLGVVSDAVKTSPKPIAGPAIAEAVYKHCVHTRLSQSGSKFLQQIVKRRNPWHRHVTTFASTALQRFLDDREFANLVPRQRDQVLTAQAS